MGENIKNDLDQMLVTLVNAVDTLSNNLGSMTSEAVDADPDISPMLSSLQTMMKNNIANLKSMMTNIRTDRTDINVAGMAGMPGIVTNQRSIRTNYNDGIPSADQIMSGNY